MSTQVHHFQRFSLYFINSVSKSTYVPKINPAAVSESEIILITKKPLEKTLHYFVKSGIAFLLRHSNMVRYSGCEYLVLKRRLIYFASMCTAQLVSQSLLQLGAIDSCESLTLKRAQELLQFSILLRAVQR